MNTQEIFTKVATHLLRQNSRSTSNVDTQGNACLYRAPDGKQCAVGCLISDGHYCISLENLYVTQNPVIEALAKSGVPTDTDTVNLLQRLQQIHDNQVVSRWEFHLKQLAIAHEFVMPESN